MCTNLDIWHLTCMVISLFRYGLIVLCVCAVVSRVACWNVPCATWASHWPHKDCWKNTSTLTLNTSVLSVPLHSNATAKRSKYLPTHIKQQHFSFIILHVIYSIRYILMCEELCIVSSIPIYLSITLPPGLRSTFTPTLPMRKTAPSLRSGPTLWMTPQGLGDLNSEGHDSWRLTKPSVCTTNTNHSNAYNCSKISEYYKYIINVNFSVWMHIQ